MDWSWELLWAPRGAGLCKRHVTLTGTVSAEDNIGQAVAVALEVDGVRDVTSTLTLKPAP